MKELSIKSAIITFLLIISIGASAVPTPDAKVQPSLVNQEAYDCTFKIQGTFDGVKVDVDITVYDVGRIECGLLKLGVIKAMK